MVQEETGPVTRADREISPLEIVNAILRHWRLVVVLPIVLGVLVGLRAYSQPRSYEVSVTFMPKGAESRSLGGAAALAQQFGITTGGAGPESPQFFADLLRSRGLLRQAVESEYRYHDEEGTLRTGTLIQIFELDRGSMLPPWRQAVQRLETSISSRVNINVGTVRFEVALRSPELTEQVAARLLELLNEFNTGIRQQRAKEEGEFVQARLEEAQSRLSVAEQGLQQFLNQNREFRNSPELLFEYERLQRQVAMRQDVYTSLLRAQEQARIDALRNTPLIAVIEGPEGTAMPRPRGTTRRAIMAFFLGAVLAIVLAVVLDLVATGRHGRDPGHAEFRRLTRQLWHDVRRPHRWIRLPWGRSEQRADPPPEHRGVAQGVREQERVGVP